VAANSDSVCDPLALALSRQELPFGQIKNCGSNTGRFPGSFGPFWTLFGEVLPASVAGVGIGLINGAGDLGGTVGPCSGMTKTQIGHFSLALAAGGPPLLSAATP
jgi:hypothetical protein